MDPFPFVIGQTAALTRSRLSEGKMAGAQEQPPAGRPTQTFRKGLFTTRETQPPLAFSKKRETLQTEALQT